MRIQALALSLLLSSYTVSASNCWQDAYGRGVGEVITTCRDGLQKDGALCYPFCRDGFYGVGPVCWQRCPESFTDTGAHCLKPAAYGRGVGYAIWNKDNCFRDHPQGCEKWGAIWYPICKESFHYFGCCVCSPDCPAGTIDIGVSCQKDSYGRGWGEVLGCRHDQEMSGALCYPPCKPGYHGNGPVCWQDCPAGKYSCGALCTDSADGCSASVQAIVGSVVAAAAAIGVAVIGGPIAIPFIIKELGGAASELANAVCDPPQFLEFTAL